MGNINDKKILILFLFILILPFTFSYITSDDGDNFEVNPEFEKNYMGIVIIPQVNTSYIKIRNVSFNGDGGVTIPRYALLYDYSITTPNLTNYLSICVPIGEVGSNKQCDLNYTISNNTPYFLVFDIIGWTNILDFDITPITFNNIIWNNTVFSYYNDTWYSDTILRGFDWFDYELTNIPQITTYNFFEDFEYLNFTTSPDLENEFRCGFPYFTNYYYAGQNNPYSCGLSGSTDRVYLERSSNTGDGSSYSLKGIIESGYPYTSALKLWSINNMSNFPYNINNNWTISLDVLFTASNENKNNAGESGIILNYTDGNQTKIFLQSSDLGENNPCSLEYIKQIEPINNGWNTFSLTSEEISSNCGNIINKTISTIYIDLYNEGDWLNPLLYIDNINISYSGYSTPLGNLSNIPLKDIYFFSTDYNYVFNNSVYFVEVPFFIDLLENDNIYYYIDYDLDYYDNKYLLIDDFEGEYSSLLNNWDSYCNYDSSVIDSFIGSVLELGSSNCTGTLTKKLSNDTSFNNDNLELNYLINIPDNIIYNTLYDSDNVDLSSIYISSNGSVNSEDFYYDIYIFNNTLIDYKIEKSIQGFKSFGIWIKYIFDFENKNYDLYYSDDYHESYNLIGTYPFMNNNTNIDYISFLPSVNNEDSYKSFIDSIYLDNISISNLINFTEWTNISNFTWINYNFSAIQKEYLVRLYYYTDYLNPSYSYKDLTINIISQNLSNIVYTNDNLEDNYINYKNYTGVMLLVSQFIWFIQFPYRIALYFDLVDTMYISVGIILIFFGIKLFSMLSLGNEHPIKSTFYILFGMSVLFWIMRIIYLPMFLIISFIFALLVVQDVRTK